MISPVFKWMAAFAVFLALLPLSLMTAVVIVRVAVPTASYISSSGGPELTCQGGVGTCIPLMPILGPVTGAFLVILGVFVTSFIWQGVLDKLGLHSKLALSLGARALVAMALIGLIFQRPIGALVGIETPGFVPLAWFAAIMGFVVLCSRDFFEQTGSKEKESETTNVPPGRT